jgi:hypothetical protein
VNLRARGLINATAGKISVCIPVAPLCAQTSAQRGKSMHIAQVFELWLASSLAVALVRSIVSAVYAKHDGVVNYRG